MLTLTVSEGDDVMISDWIFQAMGLCAIYEVPLSIYVRRFECSSFN